MISVQWFAVEALRRYTIETGRHAASLTVRTPHTDAGCDYATVSRAPESLPYGVQLDPAVSLVVDFHTLAALGGNKEAAAGYVRAVVHDLLVRPVARARQCPAPAGGCDL